MLLQVTGMAANSDAVTSRCDFPPHMAGHPAGGLVDVSAAAADHGTTADASMQQQLQEFFATRQVREAGPGQEPLRRADEEPGGG